MEWGDDAGWRVLLRKIYSIVPDSDWTINFLLQSSCSLNMQGQGHIYQGKSRYLSGCQHLIIGEATPTIMLWKKWEKYIHLVDAIGGHRCMSRSLTWKVEVLRLNLESLFFHKQNQPLNIIAIFFCLTALNFWAFGTVRELVGEIKYAYGSLQVAAWILIKLKSLMA